MRHIKTHPLLTAFTAVALFLAAIAKWLSIINGVHRPTDFISAGIFTVGAVIWILLLLRARKSKPED
ncbi:MAG: hypothetical protein KJ970_18265 [Candidatus Eisenbacteria bacterium]|uniref:Uncharacterized protein n=1 Tax=Eiseniibacteriota bacterium TaxID=2212470 RepID=A0A948RXJ2_UNCEI|nr:hypothetical protein [Candidatus Eisenbacteria bacterium]MBU1950880.1 hypothetical protein [Candidatus Eisenbacteria bacterium]MBU2692868.1 hypothetical protein [Candidatus Eisenbacteria bacterium]